MFVVIVGRKSLIALRGGTLIEFLMGKKLPGVVALGKSSNKKP